jgi:hypothetical protein
VILGIELMCEILIFQQEVASFSGRFLEVINLRFGTGSQGNFVPITWIYRGIAINARSNIG